MKHTHSTTVQIDEVIAVTCDVCKRRYEEPTEIQGFIHVKKTGSDGSIFGDGTLIECDLCQHCLKDHLGEFLILAPQ